MNDSIYGKYKVTLEKIMNDFVENIKSYNQATYEKTGYKLFEHITNRIKTEDSMREKCRRKEIPENEVSALYELKDAIGVRIIFSKSNFSW